MSRHLLSGIASLGFLACTLPSVAQDGAVPAQRIEITATRYDVRTVCPSIDEDFPAKLARMVHMIENRALVDVQFQIDGRRIFDLDTRGGSFDTRTATRRAVRSLDCNNGSAGRQTVRFEVLYRLDDMSPSPEGPGMVSLATQIGQSRSAK